MEAKDAVVVSSIAVLRLPAVEFDACQNTMSNSVGKVGAECQPLRVARNMRIEQVRSPAGKEREHL